MPMVRSPLPLPGATVVSSGSIHPRVSMPVLAAMPSIRGAHAACGCRSPTSATIWLVFTACSPCITAGGQRYAAMMEHLPRGNRETGNEGTQEGRRGWMDTQVLCHGPMWSFEPKRMEMGSTSGVRVCSEHGAKRTFAL